MSDGVLLGKDLAKYVREMVKWWRETREPKRGNSPVFQSGGPLFYNDSGEEIPPYACMQVTGVEDRDGINYMTVDKPQSGGTGPYLFNGPYEIEIDGDGTAQSGPVIRGLVDAGTGVDYTVGNTARATESEWYLTQGGNFVVCGIDEIDDDIVKLWGPTGFELYRFELQETIESGDGGVTGPTTIIKNFDKTLTHTSEAVLVNTDGMIDGMGDGSVGICKYENFQFWFVQAKCGQTCSTSSSVPPQTPTDATIGSTTYSWTPTSSGTINSWAQSGKPADFSFNTSTGALTGPGSPGVAGPARVVPITLTATVPKIGGGTCSITRIVRLTIKA